MFRFERLISSKREVFSEMFRVSGIYHVLHSKIYHIPAGNISYAVRHISLRMQSMRPQALRPSVLFCETPSCIFPLNVLY